MEREPWNRTLKFIAKYNKSLIPYVSGDKSIVSIKCSRLTLALVPAQQDYLLCRSALTHFCDGGCWGSTVTAITTPA